MKPNSKAFKNLPRLRTGENKSSLDYAIKRARYPKFFDNAIRAEIISGRRELLTIQNLAYVVGIGDYMFPRTEGKRHVRRRRKALFYIYSGIFRGSIGGASVDASDIGHKDLSDLYDFIPLSSTRKSARYG